MGIKDLDAVVAIIKLYLDEYERIYVIDNSEPEIQELIERFCQIVSLKKGCKHILILTTEENNSSISRICKKISEEEYNCLRSIYDTYEYSNRVVMVSLRQSCGSLFNYVNNSILTKEEFFEAILH